MNRLFRQNKKISARAMDLHQTPFAMRTTILCIWMHEYIGRFFCTMCEWCMKGGGNLLLEKNKRVTVIARMTEMGYFVIWIEWTQWYDMDFAETCKDMKVNMCEMQWIVGIPETQVKWFFFQLIRVNEFERRIWAQKLNLNVRSYSRVWDVKNIFLFQKFEIFQLHNWYQFFT